MDDDLPVICVGLKLPYKLLYSLKFSFRFSYLVSAVDTPFAWVRNMTVSDDLTITMFPNGCPTSFPSLEINQWTEAGSGNTKTFTKSSNSITITQQSAPASGASGTFSLKFHGQDGEEYMIDGKSIQFFIYFHAILNLRATLFGF